MSNLIPDRETAYVHCVGPDCTEKVADHRWGKTKAVGWFFSREDDKAYCPAHVPEWVEAWRKKRDGIPEGT